MQIHVEDLLREADDAGGSIWILEVRLEAGAARNSAISRDVLHPKVPQPSTFIPGQRYLSQTQRQKKVSGDL